MEINSVDSSIINSILQNENLDAQYAVKLIKMIQQTEAIAGSILEDTAEISQEAMERFLSEM